MEREQRDRAFSSVTRGLQEVVASDSSSTATRVASLPLVDVNVRQRERERHEFVRYVTAIIGERIIGQL